MRSTDYRVTDSFVFFWQAWPSQWWPSPFSERLAIDGPRMRFGCAEQYVMARKAVLFCDDRALERIMATDDPEEQKSFGRSVRGFVDSVWKANAKKIALRANVAKYGQNLELGQRLAATGTRRFVEGSPYDRIWGVGLSWNDPRIEVEANWRGLNLLGATIDETRRVLSLRLEHGVATRGIDAV